MTPLVTATWGQLAPTLVPLVVAAVWVTWAAMRGAR